MSFIFLTKMLNDVKRTITSNKIVQSVSILISLYAVRNLYWFAYRKYYQLPPGPNGYPFFGTLIQQAKDRQFMINMAKTYGPITFAPLIASSHCVILNSSKLVNQLLRQTLFLNRAVVSNIDPSKTPTLMSVGHNTQPLLLVNGEKWKRRRKHVQTTLFRAMTSAFVSDIVGIAIDNELKPFLDDIMKKNSVWYPRKMCVWLAFNTIYHTLFGEPIKRDCLLYNNIMYYVNSLFKFALWSTLGNKFPFIKIFFPTMFSEISKMRTDRNQTIRKLIHSKKISKHKTYIDYTRDLVRDGMMTADEEIADTFLLFAGGTETTSSTLQFGIVLIAKHVTIQETVRNELLTVMGNGEFNIKLVHQCPLFRALVHEILRISSIVNLGVVRCCEKSIKLNVDGKEYVIPKKTIIRTNVDWIHLHNKQGEKWKNIDNDTIFLENFLSDDGKNLFVTNESFIAFGVGRRDCVGKGLAMKEIQIILAYLLINYKLTLDKEIDNVLNYRKPTNANTVFIDPAIGVKIQPL